MRMKGDRVSDEGIYLDGPDMERPKELFVFHGDLINSLNLDKSVRVLDVGCAAGAYASYLNKRFANIEVSGVDISNDLIGKARENVPDSSFFVGSILNPEIFKGNEFDVVNCTGVLPIFEDLELPIRNLVSAARKGGSVFIYTIVNDDPIDVIMSYRRSESEDGGEWEIGWNIFSIQTIENILKKIGNNLEWSWHPFDISFSLEKTEDAMRTWTIETEKKPRQLVNGACQILNMQTLHIKVN